MLHFFEQKKFLIDYLNNFVDIHNHILPGIDDGASTIEDSIKLIKRFSEFGVSTFVCTPHIMQDYYPNTPNSINAARQLLTEELTRLGMGDIRIEVAAEHMIDSNFEELIDSNQIVPLGPNHLLIEMSYLQASINFDKSLEKIIKKNYFPVLAHPERYSYWHKKTHKYSKYKDFGVLYQLNILSLGNFYGPEVRTAAINLIKNQQIDYIGTDVHNMNQLDSISKLTIPKKILDQLIPIIDNTILTFY